MKNDRRRIIICLLGAVLFWATEVEPVAAQVPRIQGQGTAASAQGNAFTAQADDPSSLHYNPAGMTQLPGVQFMAGALFSGGTTHFTGTNGATATGDRDGSIAWPPPSHAYVTVNLKDVGITVFGDLTAGVGLTVPFGSLTRWPDNGPFRNTTTFNALPLIDIKPTLAYKLFDNLSIGLGADIYTFSGLFGEGHVEQQFIWPGGMGIPAGSRMELYGNDTAVGFNASLLYTALRNAEGKPVANVAVVYRSQATLHLTGALLANGAKVQDASATFVLPQVISGGIALWPVRTQAHEWKLEMDVDYVGWKSVRNLDVHLANGVTLPQPQNWHNTYAIMVGSEYRWLQLERLPGWELALRTGYTNQQNQMPDATFNPGIPSADVHIFSTGIGFLCHEGGSFLGLTRCGNLGVGAFKPKGIGVDLSYQASLYEQRTVTGNTGIRAPVNGLYSTTLHTGGLSFRILY
ncbi:MAG TPA: outer membrane protein transport protein [Nitrospiraceae bacterium]|jgi:long-chain fatty acid transport protein